MSGRSRSVLFVCMGNICRSPTAQGVFDALLAQSPMAGEVHVDSAGTHAYHVGEPPDARSQAAAAKRGFDLSAQRARKVMVEDFARFDYVLAMDGDNLAALKRLCPAQYRDRVQRFMEYAKRPDVRDVPDPYYGGVDGFERVLDLVEEASRGLLDALADAR